MKYNKIIQTSNKSNKIALENVVFDMYVMNTLIVYLKICFN